MTAYLLAVTAVTPLYGKLGDLFGRKIVLQGALVLFLAGSALCGLAQGMTELIAFRFIQGLGGGGLMVSAQAAIGDVVPPSDRGRYSGLFGAVFGVSSVAGPLLGGFMTTHISWRWIFYVNLPLGVLALIVLAIVAAVGDRAPQPRDRLRGHAAARGRAERDHPADHARREHVRVGLGRDRRDGRCSAWPASSRSMFVERRAAEPILPPALFSNRVFVVTSAVGLVVGFALFGALTFLPLFQQTVRGLSPTASGLQLLPVMAGLLITSIVSGQIIARTGHYKVFPILGTAARGRSGCGCCPRWTRRRAPASPRCTCSSSGLGLGMVMQVLVLAVQNAVPYDMLGVATSGATLFRSIGGALGTAILGAIFTGRLTAESARPARARSRPSPTRCTRLPRRHGDHRRRLRAVAGSSPSGRCARRSRPASARPSAAPSTPTRCASSRAR